MSVNNPFYHRGAIRRAEDFYGRAAETAEILGLLRNAQSVSIIGPRRIGKSSLLLHLLRDGVRSDFQLATPKALFVLIDCQELGGSPAEEVYEAFNLGLIDAAAEAGLNLEGDGRGGTYRALDRSLNSITQSGIAPVVLLDEFELLAANAQLTPHFFARLRGLTTKYGLAYITASQRPLYAITADEQVLSSPFFNIFVTLSLGLFSAEEAHGVLCDRLEASPFAFGEPLMAHLTALVGLHPFFLHVAGYHAVQMMQQGLDPTGEDGQAALDAAVEIEAEAHLSYLWQNLSPEEQHALVTLDGPIDIMRQLEQLCLITRKDDAYQFTSAILSRFVRRQPVDGLIQAGPLLVDPQRYQAKIHNEPLPLTNSQFALLSRLAQQYGQVVHSDDLETAVWGEVLLDDPDRLKTLIKRLRRAIEPYSDWIVSERGVGYALRPPD